MSSMIQKAAPFFNQVNELVTDLNKQIGESQAARFLAKHESVLCDISLISVDAYSFYNAPCTFISSFLFTTFKPEFVDAATKKISDLWTNHPKTQPLIIAGAIGATALSPDMMLAASSGILSAQRISHQPVVKTWSESAVDWVVSKLQGKHD